MNFTGKQVVVLGMGESGRAAAELLLEKGASVIIRDELLNERVERVAARLRQRGVRVEAPASAFSPCRFDLGVLSPGIDPRVPLVRQLRGEQTPVIGELELAARFCEAPIVAVTGTNGKSTTTEMIAAVFTAAGKKTAACGNLGQPLSDVVREGGHLDVATVEVSSFQLETIETFRPRVAVYLNFAPDHLDRYASLEEYRAAKNRVFENQTADDFAVVNPDCILPELRAKRVTIHAYGREADYTFRDGALWAGAERVLDQSDTALVGPHNSENQLAALAVADIFGIERSATISALRAYRSLPHRCELVAGPGGVRWINDSKATNLHSLESALRGMDPPCVLIAGGKDKGFDYAAIKHLLARHAAHVVLIGEARERMHEAWCQHVRCQRADTLDEAVAVAARQAVPGQTVLFSPGCSSYDMFRNFEHRGDVFREAVRQLTVPTTTPNRR